MRIVREAARVSSHWMLYKRRRGLGRTSIWDKNNQMKFKSVRPDRCHPAQNPTSECSHGNEGTEALGLWLNSGKSKGVLSAAEREHRVGEKQQQRRSTMSGEGPKLFTDKPRKSKPKASRPTTMASSSSSGTAAAPPPSPGRPPPPPPKPQPQKMFFSRRLTGVLWPLILVANFTIAGYVLITRYIGTGPSESETKDVPTSSTPPFTEPIQRAPIPEDQQRQLFKWLLEEKRKVKPKDAEEKRRIDEEKSILKQFIRAESIPGL